MTGRRTLVAGVGAARGVTAEEVFASVCRVLADAGLVRSELLALVTVTARAHEAGLVGAAASLGVPLFAHPAVTLAGVPVPHPSARVLAAVGTPGVAEAAALVGPVVGEEFGRLVVAKTRGVGPRPRCTVAIARHGEPGMARSVVRAMAEERHDGDRHEDRHDGDRHDADRHKIDTGRSMAGKVDSGKGRETT